MKLKLYTSEGSWELTHYKTIAVLGLIISSPITSLLVLLYSFDWQAATIAALALLVVILISGRGK